MGPQKRIGSKLSLSIVTAGVFLLLMSDIGLAQQERRIVRKEERRVALVIGNGDYKSSPLRNPPNDAADVAAVLTELGFKVTKLVNATQSQMRKAVRQFGRDLKKGGVGLFFYAGHGVQVKGVSQIPPLKGVV